MGRFVKPDNSAFRVTLPDALSRIKNATGQKFIVIIDEWDVLIRDEAANVRVQNEYISFYRACLKELSQQSIFSWLI